MYLTQKIALKPTKEQEKLFNRWSGTVRFIYNLGLELRIKCYEQSETTVSMSDIKKYITSLKKDSDYSWLSNTPRQTIDEALRDLDKAFKKFFEEKEAGFPKFKSKKNSNKSFFVRPDSLNSVDNYHIKFNGITVKTYESIKIVNNQVKNPRIKFDGKYWYITFSVEINSENKEIPVIKNKFKHIKHLRETTTTPPLGIDLGVKELAVLSNKAVYHNINKESEIQRLERRKEKLQQIVSRKYNKNKQGNKSIKTKNIQKLEKKVGLIDRRLSNIRNTYIHQITTEIVRTKPSKIVIEDLAISNMLKNKYLSKAIQDQKLYFFRQVLTYKCSLYGIPLKIVNRFYPSSKTCSSCGFINKQLRLEDRIFNCPRCDFTIDRDLNASINLSLQ